ncbi:PspC domain-containing protein [Lactococcus taiwanensis]|uniref:PspC domain-containing protein n=1 Tax=Lactococcus taiwanensis TaxID=1151742 RepID=A0AA45KHD0_9LACT|nr:PspC domain-containing protein [Lactococcus taiwanensis]QSE76578.1 PspC domain-containing protein [Lactococcus taiwanensis]
MKKKRLKRSDTNRVIAGTVGGLGEYFDLSRRMITIIRVLLVIGTFGSWGSLLIVYVIVSLLMTQSQK